MAMVGAPWARAAAMTPTMSGEAPDWLIPMTSASERSGATPYSDTIDGIPSPTDSRCRTPRTYCA